MPKPQTHDHGSPQKGHARSALARSKHVGCICSLRRPLPPPSSSQAYLTAIARLPLFPNHTSACRCILSTPCCCNRSANHNTTMGACPMKMSSTSCSPSWVCSTVCPSTSTPYQLSSSACHPSRQAYQHGSSNHATTRFQHSTIRGNQAVLGASHTSSTASISTSCSRSISLCTAALVRLPRPFFRFVCSKSTLIADSVSNPCRSSYHCCNLSSRMQHRIDTCRITSSHKATLASTRSKHSSHFL